MRILPVILIVLAVPTLAHVATLIVPSQYPTIQTAVDASKIGDTVLVMPGTYIENVEYVETHLLEADLFSLSEVTGGAVELSLHAGAGNGNRQYILLGGITGTAPGVPLPGGSAILPVNWDLFTRLVIGLLNTPSFSNFAGTLDASGDAVAKLDSKGPLPPGALGVFMRFAFGLNQPWNLASNPVSIEIVP